MLTPNADGLLHADYAYKTHAAIFPLQYILPSSFGERIEERDISTTARQAFAKYNRSCHLKVIETKSNQSLVFDPGEWFVVCVAIYSGRAAHVVSWGVNSGSICYSVQLCVRFFLTSCFQ